jgi:hypothetical protein
MPILLPPRRPKPARESFLLKSMLVASALLVCAVAAVRAEFELSSPGRSLSEVEAPGDAETALRLAAVTIR